MHENVIEAIVVNCIKNINKQHVTKDRMLNYTEKNKQID